MTELLTDAQVAELLECDEKTVQERTRDGTLPAVKFGRSWRYPKTALMQALHDMAMANRTKPKNKPTAAPTRFDRRSKIPDVWKG